MTDEVTTIDRNAGFGKTGNELLAIYDKYTRFFDLSALVREVLPAGYPYTKDNISDVYFSFIAATRAGVDVNEVEETLQGAYAALGAKDSA